jgi:hypothetical protein
MFHNELYLSIKLFNPLDPVLGLTLYKNTGKKHSSALIDSNSLMLRRFGYAINDGSHNLGEIMGKKIVL